jgi:hypothetical protein
LRPAKARGWQGGLGVATDQTYKSNRSVCLISRKLWWWAPKRGKALHGLFRMKMQVMGRVGTQFIKLDWLMNVC